MKTWHKIASFITLVLIICSYFLQPNHSLQKVIGIKTQQTASLPINSVSPPINNALSTCHIRGLLPDPTCTPGSIDTRVTQATISQTICMRGYTKTVRPPVAYTNSLKVQQISAYGYTDTNPHDYEEDHLISLELGGDPTNPANLWPQPGNSPNPKDKIENLCHEKVCSGEITLADAQREIASNWQNACQ